MIFDKIENASRYLGISKNMDIALKFIMENDLNALPNGRNEVAGNDVFVNVMNVTTNGNWSRAYEYHRNYYDIHIVLEGSEKVLVTEELEKETQPYSTESDYGLGSGSVKAIGCGAPGYFVINNIEEPHMPGCSDPGCEMEIRKAVVKVRG